MFTVTGLRDTETQRKESLKKKPPRLHVSVTLNGEWRRSWLVAAISILWLPLVHAQQLLDRVVARVDGAPITLTDVQSAIGLGSLGFTL